MTFTAVLTDPDGGGPWSAARSSTSRGCSPLLRGPRLGAPGLLSLPSRGRRSTRWAHRVPESESRVFLAEFLRAAAGHRSTRTVTLRLHCDGRGGGVCNGRCTSLSANLLNQAAWSARLPVTWGVPFAPPARPLLRRAVRGTPSARHQRCGGCGQACAPGFTPPGRVLRRPPAAASGGDDLHGLLGAGPAAAVRRERNTSPAPPPAGRFQRRVGVDVLNRLVSGRGAVQRSRAHRALRRGRRTTVRGTCQRLCGGVICTPEQV